MTTPTTPGTKFTVAQRALLRRLADDYQPKTFVLLRGAEARVASNLEPLGLVFIGVRKHSDPKGLPVKLTDKGAVARRSFGATGTQEGIVESLLHADAARLDAQTGRA